MVKNFILKCGIFIIVFCMGIFTCYLYNNLEINKLEERTNKQKKIYTEYNVFSDKFESYISYDGTIELSEEQEYFFEIELYYKQNKEECDLQIKKGDIINKNTYIGKTYNQNLYKQIYSKNNLKIDSIYVDEEEHIIIIKVLNYDALYYTVYIDKQDIEKIGYDTKVYYYNDEKKVKCNIEYIGNEILEGDVIETKIKTIKYTKNIPGDKKEINFVIDKKKKNLFLSADAITLKGEKTYILKKVGNEYLEEEIIVGQKITITEGEDEYDYFVVESGLTDGDTVYVETIKYDTDEGLKNVINE